MASGSFSYTYPRQRENDFRYALISTQGFKNYTYISATINYSWSSSFPQLTQTVKFARLDQLVVAASGAGGGYSGTFTISGFLDPNTTYFFHGTAVSSGGAIFAWAQASVSVSWVTIEPPVITSFVTNNEEITAGQTSTLSWTISDNPTTVSIDQGIGSVSANAATVVSPTQTTTYTLSASNVAGSATPKSVTITVYPKPEIDSFTISSTDILQGNTITAQWQTTGATTVVLSGSSGAFPASQFPPSNVNVDGSYSWTAGEGGSYTIKLTAYNQLEVKEEKILSFTVRDETPNAFEWEDKTEVSLLERLNQESETITINGFGPTQYPLSQLPIKSNYPIEVMVNGDGIWRNVEEI